MDCSLLGRDDRVAQIVRNDVFEILVHRVDQSESKYWVGASSDAQVSWQQLMPAEVLEDGGQERKAIMMTRKRKT